MAISIRLQQSKFKEANRGGKWHARIVSNGETSTAVYTWLSYSYYYGFSRRN